MFGDPRLPERFWAKVEPEPNSGCWLWTGHVKKDTGYGTYAGKGVHRIAYEALVGPIRPGLEPDHLCRVRCCANTAHLEAVTKRVNILRGEGPPAKNARKLLCVYGHPLTPGTRQRMCRPCRTRQNRESEQRVRAKDPEAWRERRRLIMQRSYLKHLDERRRRNRERMRATHARQKARACSE